MKNLAILLIIMAILPSALLGQAADIAKGILVSDASDKNILEIRTPDNLACTIDITAHQQKTVEINYTKWTNATPEETRQRYLSLIVFGLYYNPINTFGIGLGY